VKNLSRLALAAGIALALGGIGTGFAATTSPQPTTNEQAIDASRGMRILTSFNTNRHLRGYDLSAKVEGDKAMISGNVEDIVAKDLAEQIAMGVDGIKRVDNRIVVDSNYQHAKREDNDRNFGEHVEDATVTASVKSKLLWNSHTDGLDIHVDTNYGKVTLTGTANSADEKALAGRIARDTEDVRGVKNEIVVNGQPATSTKAKRSERDDKPPSDSWITAKVKSSLMFTRSVEAFDFTVTTIDGKVSLNGIVDSAADRDRAVQVAMDVRGVKKVDASGVKTQ
jgi:osmotically-inducible protein OsmY